MYITITRRRLWGGLAALLILIAGGVGMALPPTAPVAANNWGLSYPAEGQTPRGNATAEALAEHNAHFVGDTTKKCLYLTFDAGYEAGHTPAILDALHKHGVPATFFVVEHYLDSAPEMVQRMVAEGHTVANHTATHPDMSAMDTQADFLRELTRVEEAYAAITGQTMPKLYRPPRGAYSEQNLRMAAEAGYHTFFWSVAYVDWYVDRQPTREQALEKLLPRTHPGAIVLLHSTSATNAEILDELLTKWKEMGYTFAPLTELCDGGGA